jgi:hypothetical protein
LRLGNAGRGWSLWVSVALLFGCTTLAGIDDDYVQATPLPVAGRGGSGGALGGGSAGDGGALGSLGSAGTLGSGGSSGSAGTTAGGSAGTGGTGGMTCSLGQKFCNGECTLPRPLVGCALDSCMPCDVLPPDNGHATCDDEICSFECDANFVLSQGKCVPMGTGGTGGTAGTSGTGGTAGTAGTGGSGGGPCVMQQCRGCIPHGPFGCCLNSTTCGCTWAPGAVCYPG